MQLSLPEFNFRDGARRSSRPWQELVVDNFAGAGGASLGIERAICRAVDISINHDPDAIEMHRVNHPASRHLCENVWQVDPAKLIRSRPVGLAWFSPDCRHFSRAKGGKPVEKNIRGLAWVVLRWAASVKPRIIILENVREFRTWGPLNRNHRPIKSRAGTTFQRWLGQLRALGYVPEVRELDAADFGAPTHRRRLFIIARRDGHLINWPEATHGKANQDEAGLDARRAERRRRHAGRCGVREAAAQQECLGEESARPVHRGRSVGPDISPEARGEQGGAARASHGRTLRPYRTAAECIDWTIPCPSIFDRPRPLAEKTMRRIAMGLKRYVLDNPRPFIVQVNHGGDEFRGQDLDRPFPTISAKHGYGVVTPYMVEVQNASAAGTRAVDRPAHTITAKPKGGGMAVVAPTLIQTGYGERDGQAPRALDLHEPLGTVVSGGQKHALVSAWLVKHFGGMVGVKIDTPLPTTTARGTQNQVACAYLARFNHGDKQWNAVTDPLGTITSQGNKFGLVYAFLTSYYGQGIGQPLDVPLRTATVKDRFCVVAVEVEPGKTENAVMLDVPDVGPCLIADIGMRMLSPRELARAQGFPDSYILTGTKSNQVAKIGNSVCPPVAEAVVRANFREAEEVAA
jgi:DNA (cytosine-5)-methyltransferase 1